MNKLETAIAAKLFEVIFERVAQPGDVDAGPYKLRVPKTEWDTNAPTGSYGTVDPNGKVFGVINHTMGGPGQPNSISDYVDKLQNSDGSEEKSQNLFQR